MTIDYQRILEDQPDRIVFMPNSSSQILALSAPCREILLEGTRGWGKSAIQLFRFAQEVGKGYGPYWRGTIFRREYKHLDDLVAKSKIFFRQIFPTARWYASKADYKWVWPTGEELMLRAAPDENSYWDHHGQEYPYIGLEELTNWPTIGFYDAIRSCCRTSFRGQMPLVMFATTNPYGAGHNWVKRYFMDVSPRGIPYRDPASGIYRVAIFGHFSQNGSLDKEYINTLRSIKDPVKRQAWLMGSWDLNHGGMFDDLWSSAYHVIEPFDVPWSWRIDRSFDWGQSRPFSVGYWAESDGSPVVRTDREGRVTKTYYPPGHLVRIAEIYGCEKGQENVGLKMPARKVAEMIRQFEERAPWGERCMPGPADNAIFNDDDEGNSIAKKMESQGVYWTQSDKSPGSRKNGIEVFRDMLQASHPEEFGEGIQEFPGISVVSSCRDFIRTVPSLPRDEADPDDVDTDAEDHIWDDTRYRILQTQRSFHRGRL